MPESFETPSEYALEPVFQSLVCLHLYFEKDRIFFDAQPVICEDPPDSTGRKTGTIDYAYATF